MWRLGMGRRTTMFAGFEGYEVWGFGRYGGSGYWREVWSCGVVVVKLRCRMLEVRCGWCFHA
jgi:hypothetical protein